MSTIDDENWYDTGCHVHPTCLTCPLEQCIFDTTTADLLNRRNVAIVQDLLDGISKQDIADYYGLSVRQIERVKAAFDV